ncbi:MAG TPA: hypothetical protein VGC09_19090 [Rhodopila sp.]
MIALSEEHRRPVPLRMSRWSASIGEVVGASLLLAVGAFLYRYSFNWPFTDDINTIIWYKRFFLSHELGLFDLLRAWDNSHPVGVQALVTTLLLKAFGINLVAILTFSVALITLSSVVLYRGANQYLNSPLARVAFWPMLILMVFHPTQMEHLLWPFEVGWFLVNFILFSNAVAFERYGIAALPMIVMGCLIASFCSAQGSLLWFVAGAHCLIRPKFACRGALGLAFISIGILGAAAILHRVGSQAGEYSLAGTDVLGLPWYALLLLGGIFGVHGHAALGVLGLTLVCVVILMGLQLYREARFGPPERIAITMVLASALFVMSFSVGRSKFGIDWATSTFHDAPLLVPFMVGVLILSLRLFPGHWLALIAVVLLGASVASALPYGIEYADGWLMQRGLAMRITCDAEAPRDLIDRANGLAGYDAELNEAMPVIRPLCTDGPYGRAARLLVYPQAFRDLGLSHPESSDHLLELWRTYITRLDLLRAFPVDDPRSPTRLLDWARSDTERHWNVP